MSRLFSSNIFLYGLSCPNSNHKIVLRTSSTSNSPISSGHSHWNNPSRICRRQSWPSMEIQTTISFLHYNSLSLNIHRSNSLLSYLSFLPPHRKTIIAKFPLSFVHNMFGHIQNEHYKHNGRNKWAGSGSEHNSSIKHASLLLCLNFSKGVGR